MSPARSKFKFPGGLIVYQLHSYERGEEDRGIHILQLWICIITFLDISVFVVLRKPKLFYHYYYKSTLEKYLSLGRKSTIQCGKGLTLGKENNNSKTFLEYELAVIRHKYVTIKTRTFFNTTIFLHETNHFFFFAECMKTNHLGFA